MGKKTQWTLLQNMAAQDRWGRVILQQGIIWGHKIKTTQMIFSLESCLSWTVYDHILEKF